ncbi:DUF192 domain-containing protein [Thermus amyloliquefaciens]|uniref:DUF192 domain-containing protein n=1 Tax=Thermus amyloliquefaciens TaxID=1449080 RepID=UPI000571120D|nr:DUF192 domain-containing protein [Thermus amyloliquefaciens]
MDRNPLFPLVAFALLVALSVFSFMGYLLAVRRWQTPPPPQRVVVETQKGPRTLQARLARTPEAWARGLGVRNEPLEALLYLFPQATDAPFSTAGYRFPVTLAFLDAQGQVLKVIRLEPDRTYAPGLAYRGVLEVREGVLDLSPGDRVLP